MKTFTKQEIRDLLNKVIMDEISFTRMVEIMNERVSERMIERVDIPEEPKKGDLAIFWDVDKGSAFIGEYVYFIRDAPFPHRDNSDSVWANAIKFESIEQYERLIKGEI